MKVTFIKACGPVLQSGWEHYAAGVKADLRDGAWLVANGYAVDGWRKVDQVNQEAPQAPESEPQTEHYNAMTLRNLRKLAKSAGILGYSSMNRKTLVKRLEAE